MQKRIIATAGLVLLFVVTYFGTATWLPIDAGRSLAMPIDAWIPFMPAAVLVYVSVYVGVLLPMFTVRSASLFTRVVWAYCAVTAVCGVCFAVFPVSALSLRPELPPLSDPSFMDWGIRLLYALDPPTNLFPSLHVALAWCAAIASWKAQRSFAKVLGPWALAVSAATCLTKQHYVVDVFAGATLGALTLWCATRSLEPADIEADEAAVPIGLRWPVGLYLVLVAAFFAAFSAL